MQYDESIGQPWHRTKPTGREVIQPRGFQPSQPAEAMEKKRSTHTACRSLILTKTLKALRSRTPEGTKTQRIWVKTKQGHLKLTEWLLSELTQCDRSVCLKEICYIHNTHLQRKTKPVPLLLFNQPDKKRVRPQKQR